MEKAFKYWTVVWVMILAMAEAKEPVSPESCYVYHSVNAITGEYCENQTDMKVEGTEPLYLRRSYSSADTSTQGWHFNFPHILSPPADPSSGEEACQGIQFTYCGDETGAVECAACSPEGKFVRYRFSQVAKSRHDSNLLLEHVSTSSGKEIRYSYADHPKERRKLLVKREELEGRYVVNEYYDSFINNVGGEIVQISDMNRDPRIGKVKLQKAPVGVNGQEAITARFFYEQGKTIVYDGENHKTAYHYGKNQKLSCIESFYDDGTLIRKEKYYWNPSGQLTSKAVEDHQGAVCFCETYDYDLFGNLVKKSLVGNLTGTCSQEIMLDSFGKPLQNGVESYSTHYRYSDDDKHLLVLEKEESGLSNRYLYNDAGKIACLLTYDDKQLRIRQLFSYDAEGGLKEIIIDDGASEDRNDLCDVRERRLSRYFLREHARCKGAADAVEEIAVDPQTGDETLIKKTIYHYLQSGEIASQECYAASQLTSAISYEYDSYGRPVRIHDMQKGTKEIGYDALGNPTVVCEEGRAIFSAYDPSNRLICRETIQKGAPQDIVHYRYDRVGNQIESSDAFGNTTAYTYDALQRLIKKELPKQETPQGGDIRPTWQFTYDAMDRIIASVDPNGRKTITSYNVRGNPREVLHPDGSTETWEYRLDGALAKRVLPDGSEILYQSDYQLRTISEQHFSPEGMLVKAHFREYNAFRLVSEEDHLGKKTRYSYDLAGNNVETIEEFNGHAFHTKISYDECGNVTSRTEWQAGSESHCRTACLERGPSGSAISVAIRANSGELLKKTALNAQDSEPSEEHVLYLYDHVNALGQQVLQQAAVDAAGAQTITTYDALERPVKIEQLDPLGKTVKSKKIFYDPTGNKVEEVHEILGREGKAKPYVCKWQYDECGNITAMIEGANTPSERVHTYSYDRSGRLLSQTKPDGVTLYYAYTSFNKPSKLYSSDASISYTYTYDPCEQLIRIDDHVHGTSTVKEHDSQGRLTSETLANGLRMQYAYDAFGRRTATTLSDNSQIRYTYDEAFLRSVDRLDEKGAILYTHSYTRYRLDGLAEEEQMIAGLGTLVRRYDDKGRLLEIRSPEWRQEIARTGKGLISSLQTEDPSGSCMCSFTYDSLGQLSEDISLKRLAFDNDSLHNRIKEGEQQVVVDEMLQPLSQNGCLFSYDRCGNLKEIAMKSGSHIHMRYDALGRLTEYEDEAGHRVYYSYDSFNRLLARKRINPADQIETTRFLYDGQNEIGAAKEDGSLCEVRILGLGLGSEAGAAVAIEIGHAVFAPIHDHRGSICCLIEASSRTPVKWSRYSAYGEAENYGNGTLCSWEFSGKRKDPFTHLIYFGHRFYLPTLGRWITQDPLGHPESINRTAFNLNDPINRIDPYGLSSFQDTLSTFWGWITSAWQFVQSGWQSLIKPLSFTDKIISGIDLFGQATVGRMFLQLSGFYQDASETGVYGKGEISDKVRVTLTNGILNCRKDFKDTLQLLSETHGGVNVHYFFDATHGICWDLIKCLFVKCGAISPQAYQIANTWKKMIHEMGGISGGGLIYHYAHSIGSTHTKAALRLMSNEEKAMIRVHTFGAPSIIDDPALHAVFNYVSVRDGVCLLDPAGFFGGLCGSNDKVYPIGNWLGIPFIDHLLSRDGTYGAMIALLGEYFIQHHVAGNY